MDTSLFLFINLALQNNVFDIAMILITDSGYILFIAVMAPLFFKDWRKGLLVFTLCAAGFIAADKSADVIKSLFARPRPCHEIVNIRLLVACGKSYSFPSSHAATSFAIASIIGHLYRRGAIPAFLLATLVAFSRIHVGVHYPSDVLGGAVLGGVTGGGILVIHNWAAGHLKR